MLAISCLAYNHEPYIRQCLEGFVMQKTDFKFVAIVHDDASTDGTAAIVREYAEKYPDIIKPIYETENQYSKHDGTLGKIMEQATGATGCKYIALCEGDDFWINPHKLQSQVDFLEQNPEYSMCFHGVHELLSDGRVVTDIYKHLKQKDYTAKELFERWTVPTCSVVVKADTLRLKPKDPRFIVGDVVLFVTCATHGKTYCFADKMGVYRRLSTGWVLRQNHSVDYYMRFAKHNEAMVEHFPILASLRKTKQSEVYAGAFLRSLKEMKNVGHAFHVGLTHCGLVFIGSVILSVFNYIRSSFKRDLQK